MKQATPTTQLTVKTLLNLVQPFVGFVYHRVRLIAAAGRAPKIEVHVEPHAQSRPRCGHGQAVCPGYDRLEERRWMFVPRWGLATEDVCTPRRVTCRLHGVVVEHLPWNAGKQRITTAAMGFLARWARRLSWREGELSSAAVEGLNNKIRVVTRRSYGFRTYRAMEVALYHNLGQLPEPELTHRFG